MRTVFFILLFAGFLTEVSHAQRMYKHLYPGYFGNGKGPMKGSRFMVGAMGGVTYTDVSGQVLVQRGRTDAYDPIAGLQGGIRTMYELSGHFSLRLEALYNQKGGIYTSEDALTQIMIKTRRNYLNIPLLLQYSFLKEQHALRPHIFAGPTAAWMLNARQQYSIAYITQQEREVFPVEEAAEKFARFDYGVTGGLGLQLQPAFRWAITADVRGYYGLGNINNFPEEAVVRPNTQQIQVGATLGILYRL
jgi:outer membrane protein W